MKKYSIVCLIAALLFAPLHAANQSVTAYVNHAVTMTVVATGTPPFSYQWQRLAINAPAGTLPTILNNYTAASMYQPYVTIKDTGIYTVVVTNADGFAISDEIILTVTKAPQSALIVTSPAGVTLGMTYTATVSGGSGTGSVTWSLGAGSTAPGAAIDQWTGLVSFTGPGTVVFHATKAQTVDYGAISTPDFVLTVAGLPPTITSFTVIVN